MSCSLAVTAMVPALVFRSAGLVGLYQAGLLVSVAALGASTVLFLGLVAWPGEILWRPVPASLSRRADTLVALVLADLLDPD